MLFANAGLVLLAFDLPLMLLALLPVAALEAGWYRHWLRLPWDRAWFASLNANGQSTVLGLPVAWAGLVVWEFVVATVWPELRPVYGRAPAAAGDAEWRAWVYLTGFAAFSMPQSEDFAWMFHAYTLVLMAPAFLVSWLWETRVLCRDLPKLPRRTVRRACLGANSLSYMVLAGIVAWRLRVALAG